MLAIRRTGFMFLAMLLAIGLAVLTLLMQVDTVTTVWRAQPVAQKATIDWLRSDQVYVPGGLTIRAHAAKHNSETERIYTLLLQGQCAAVAKFCGGSDIENLYTCIDPVTGIVGAILQFGDEITTGYYERSGSGHWAGRTARENWEVCAGD